MMSVASGSEQASGCATPPMAYISREDLHREVCTHLADLCNRGLDVVAQMHAQELVRWAAAMPQCDLLQSIAADMPEFLVPGMEVGIALSGVEGQWLASCGMEPVRRMMLFQ